MKWLRSRYKLCITGLMIWLPLHSFAQSEGGPQSSTSIHDESDFLGFTTSSPPIMTFSTPADYQNGKFSDAPSSIVLTLGLAWTVSVRAATANLTSGTNTIAISNVTVQVVGASFGTGIITLTTSNQTIASGVLALLANFNFRYTMKGGTHLLKPAGDYTATVIFSTTGL